MSRAWLGLTLVSSACLAPADEGLSRWDRAAETVAVGKLRVFDGEAPTRARVVLLDASDRTWAVAELGTAGAFRLTAPEAGRIRYLAYDDAGHAALGTRVLQARGENQVRWVWLLPISEFPDLVTLRGFGLEERVATLGEEPCPACWTSRRPAGKTREDLKGQT